MIKDEIIAKRYADAFLSYAKDRIGLERGLRELQDVKHLIRDNPDLGEFLNSLEFTNAEKNGVIDAVFAHGFTDETRHFLRLLVAKKRISIIIDIAEYARVNYAHGVEIDAILKTSYPIDTDLIQRIKNALEAKMKKKLHLYVQLDTDLLGGAYVRIGNIIIDGSVKGRLEDTRAKLIAMKVA